MIKIREFKDKNYRAIWFNGKTIRIAIDPSKPIKELDYPEFYDIKITSYCKGKCPYCYMDSSILLPHAEKAINKIRKYFSHLTNNQKPFQVAIGGGEPTAHPEFLEILKVFNDLGIVPNYTTNGMWIEEDKSYRENILDYTRAYCGGVAISCHPHLSFYWKRAIFYYLNRKINLNLHIIISDKESIDYFKKIYSIYNKRVSYFVLLPYIEKGRAGRKRIDFEYLVKKLPKILDNIAFGARFYDYLKNNPYGIKISLYEPEIMSKFLDLENMKVCKSSFE